MVSDRTSYLLILILIHSASPRVYRGLAFHVIFWQVMNQTVNLYPCGLVISPFSSWIAASPDRKVYCPARDPPFGLLEIKCPQNAHISDVKYLEDKQQPFVPRLNRSHDYYYQVMCQLAVTGLEWCDLFVYLESGESHLETISFDPIFWVTAQAKIDSFFFEHYMFATE